MLPKKHIIKKLITALLTSLLLVSMPASTILASEPADVPSYETPLSEDETSPAYGQTDDETAIGEILSEDELPLEVSLQEQESTASLPTDSIELAEDKTIVFGQKYEGDLTKENQTASFRIPITESGRVYIHAVSFDGATLPAFSINFLEETRFEDQYIDVKSNTSLSLSAKNGAYGHYSFIVDFASAKESFPCTHVNESEKNKISLNKTYYGQLGYGKTMTNAAYKLRYTFSMPEDGAIRLEASQWSPKKNYGIKNKSYNFSYKIVQGMNSTCWKCWGKDVAKQAVLKKGTYTLIISSEKEAYTGNLKFKLSTKNTAKPVRIELSEDALNFPQMLKLGKQTYASNSGHLYATVHYSDGETVRTDSNGEMNEMAVVWSVNDASVAKVSSNGAVYATGYGKTVITATSLEDKTVTAKIPVTVKFSDVTNSKKYYYKPVYWAADHQIAGGTSFGEPDYGVYFSPEKSCTRLQFMTFLWKLAGTPKADTSLLKKFSDINAKSKGASAVAWGIEKGIINGYKDGTFKPSKKVTRKEVLLMLYRAAGKPAVKGTLKFKDITAPKNSDTYKALLWGVKNKITSGKSAEKFAPADNCIRGQVVTFLYRYARLK